MMQYQSVMYKADPEIKADDVFIKDMKENTDDEK